MKNPFHLYHKVTVYMGMYGVRELYRAAWDGLNDGVKTRYYRQKDGRKIRINTRWIIFEVQGWLSPEEKAILTQMIKQEAEA